MDSLEGLTPEDALAVLNGKKIRCWCPKCVGSAVSPATAARHKAKMKTVDRKAAADFFDDVAESQSIEVLYLYSCQLLLDANLFLQTPTTTNQLHRTQSSLVGTSDKSPRASSSAPVLEPMVVDPSPLLLQPPSQISTSLSQTEPHRDSEPETPTQFPMPQNDTEMHVVVPGQGAQDVCGSL